MEFQVSKRKQREFEKLIQDAVDHGYRVIEDGESISLVKGRRKLKGVMIFPDGSGVRVDILLSVSLSIRGDKNYRKILEI